jgi:hypothetical protein
MFSLNMAQLFSRMKAAAVDHRGGASERIASCLQPLHETILGVPAHSLDALGRESNAGVLSG